MTPDKIIADEILNTLDERIAQYSENTKRHRFSLAYKIQRRRIIKNAEKPAKRSYRYPLRRVKYVLVAVALAVPLLTGFSVWKDYGKFTFNVHRDHLVLYIDSSPEYKTTLEELYELELDDGWETRYHDVGFGFAMMNFKKGDKSIAFSQNLINKGINGNIGTQYEKKELVSIYEENDGLLLKFDRNEIYLIWIYDGYLFELGSNLDKEEIIELARTLKVKT